MVDKLALASKVFPVPGAPVKRIPYKAIICQVHEAVQEKLQTIIKTIARTN